MNVFTPHDPEGNALTDRANPLWIEMNKDRGRVSVEICYSSTLGECWTLRAGAMSAGTTTDTHNNSTLLAEVGEDSLMR
jgi:hypothetical protein